MSRFSMSPRPLPVVILTTISCDFAKWDDNDQSMICHQRSTLWRVALPVSILWIFLKNIQCFMVQRNCRKMSTTLIMSMCDLRWLSRSMVPLYLLIHLLPLPPLLNWVCELYTLFQTYLRFLRSSLIDVIVCASAPVVQSAEHIHSHFCLSSPLHFSPSSPASKLVSTLYQLISYRHWFVLYITLRPFSTPCRPQQLSNAVVVNAFYPLEANQTALLSRLSPLSFSRVIYVDVMSLLIDHQLPLFLFPSSRNPHIHFADVLFLPLSIPFYSSTHHAWRWPLLHCFCVWFVCSLARFLAAVHFLSSIVVVLHCPLYWLSHVVGFGCGCFFGIIRFSSLDAIRTDVHPLPVCFISTAQSMLCCFLNLFFQSNSRSFGFITWLAVGPTLF